MKGLLLKDARQIFRAWYFWLIQVILLLITYRSEFALSTACYLIACVSLAVLSEDEQSRWQSYCLTLPCTKVDYVSGKYLLQMLLFGILLVEMAVFWLLWGAWIGIGLAYTLIRTMTAVLLPMAICLPLVFRFGGKAVADACILAAVMMPFSWFLPSDLLGQTAFALVALWLFGLSWPLSVYWYKLRWKRGGAA